MNREQIVARIQILSVKLDQVRQKRDEAIRMRHEDAVDWDDVVATLEHEIDWLRQWLARRDSHETTEQSDSERPPES
jgi:hypothetical protein